MHKTTSNGNTVFHPSVKTYLPPTIKDEFVSDEGERTFILSNGNTINADKYNAVWNPPKGIVNMKGKGERLDGKQRIY
jgi:hypothetical protein